ncbi:MAG: purine/pyrimidine permease [Alistipes sp.]|nr:purine/pyrimidine permease [Alistipes sp.]
MELKYGIDDRPKLGQLLVYSLQWFVLAVAVIVTSIFIAQGSDAEKVFYAQKVFAFMGVATILQIFIGHRMPIISGPASVLLVGIITALTSQGEAINTNKIYTSLIVGGVAVVLLSAGRLLEYMQKIFTPRIVVVIMMLIAYTLGPTIKNLIFPASNPECHTFALWFALLGVPAMVVANSRLKGVLKSVVVPLSLFVGCLLYYIVQGGFAEIFIGASTPQGRMFLPAVEFDWSMIVAFLICYIALLINDIGSIQSTGALLQTPQMDRRCRRGVGLTGVLNIVAGSMGIIGPVNYTMSPGVIASSSCASRYALLPASLGLIVCAFIPPVITLLTAIPNSVIGVILLYLMGTQLAASFSTLVSGNSIKSFDHALTVGLPIIVALVFGIIPMSVIPEMLRPIIGNGFVMGVLTVILLEHLLLKERKSK